jgi:P4 family phage/plasmid primase-like protien
MDPRTVLGVLFGLAGPGETIEVRRVPSAQVPPAFVEPTDPDLSFLGDWVGANVFFSVCTRGPDLSVASGTLVWLDADAKSGPVPDPSQTFPRPTLAASSGGGGVHLYWALSEAVAPNHALRLSKLAALAFGGDRHAVNSPARVMRLPGTLNHKYEPPTPCLVTFSPEPPLRWDPAELEGALVARIAANHWAGGDRHALALALSAVLVRSGWGADRVVPTIRLACDMAEDEEWPDRVSAAKGTATRFAQGLPVSSAAWRDALGEEDGKFFLDGLGVTLRDGQLTRLGEVLGSAAHLEASLVDGFIADGEWAYADGSTVRWDGRLWVAADDDVLRYAVFEWARAVCQVTEGEDVPIVVSAKLAGAVASLVRGKLAQSPLPPPNPAVLPLLNGALDPDTLELRPIKREDHFRWSLAVEWDPEATCPTWDKFLLAAVPQEDPEAEVRYLQEWGGYYLLPGNPWQILLWLYGLSGTGKSKFIGTLAAIFGDGAVSIKADKFDDYTVASLAHARIATCTELSNRTLRTSLLKALVAGDPVQGRHPYGRPFVVIFDGKFLWGSNYLPPVDEGEGAWRRFKVVVFDNVPPEVDVNLDEKLRAELPGIFRWMLGGRTRVLGYTAASKWPEPPSVRAKVLEYRQSADTFGQFAADELELGPEYRVTGRELYTSYANWAKEHGHRVEPMGPLFRREMGRLGVKPDKEPTTTPSGRPVLYWVGGKLRPDAFVGNLT